MPYAFGVNQLDVDVLTNANVTTSGAQTVNSSELDVSGVEGNILLTVSARASGTGTVTVAVEHSYTTSTGFTAVPAAALINANTGEADTFDTWSTAASTQTLGLRKDLLRRYVRVTYSGTNLNQNIATFAVTMFKYTERD
jgi:hypothetical protein